MNVLVPMHSFEYEISCDIISMPVIFCNSAILGSYVIERSKKCLDFCSTIYIIHLIIVTIYDQFPWNWEWWIINGISLTIMVVLCEYICLRRELLAIPLGTSVETPTTKTITSSPTSNPNTANSTPNALNIV